MAKKVELATARADSFRIFVQGIPVATVGNDYINIEDSDMSAEEFESFARVAIDALNEASEEE